MDDESRAMHEQIVTDLNIEAAQTIIHPAKNHNSFEEDLCEHLRNKDIKDSLYMPTLQKNIQLYRKENIAASRRQLQYRTQAAKRNLAHVNKGPAAVKRATNDKPVKPVNP